LSKEYDIWIMKGQALSKEWQDKTGSYWFHGRDYDTSYLSLLNLMSANWNIVCYLETNLTSESYKNAAVILYHILICQRSGCDRRW
jgi:hypothetical protein